MPKFLDTPQWYDETDGSLLYGIGTDKAMGAGVAYHGPSGVRQLDFVSGSNGQILTNNGYVPRWRNPTYIRFLKLSGSYGGSGTSSIINAYLFILYDGNIGGTANSADDIANWLYSKGFNSYVSLYPCSGDCAVNSVHYPLEGIYATSTNGASIYVYHDGTSRIINGNLDADYTSIFSAAL